MKYFIFIFSVLLLICCQGINDSKSQIIHSDLVGEWMSVHDQGNNYPSPNYIYHGWRINSDGTIYALGVNGDTGKVDYYDTDSRRSPNILFANNGKMVIRHISRSVRTDTVSFNITSNTLNIGGSVLQGSYKRTFIGSVAAYPPSAYLSVNIDDIPFKNRQVSKTIPSAYVVKGTNIKLTIHAGLNDQNHRIIILIDDYQGPGTYSIDEDQAIYLRRSGDFLSVRVTRYDSSGAVTIECDLDYTRCSGEFYFDAYRRRSPTTPNNLKAFDNGSFDLPVYK